MQRDQLELSLEGAPSYRPPVHRSYRPRRAHWWFQQMRQIVERALDRNPAPRPRSEQIYFALSRRQMACETTMEKGG